jgi:hypothetical protein
MLFGKIFWWLDMGVVFVVRFIGWIMKLMLELLRGGK